MSLENQIVFANAKEEATQNFMLKNRFDVPLSYKFRCPKDNVVDIIQSKGVVPAKGECAVTFKFVPMVSPVKARQNVQLRQVPLTSNLSADKDPFEVFKDDVISQYIDIIFAEELEQEQMEEEFFSPQAYKPSRKKGNTWWQK